MTRWFSSTGRVIYEGADPNEPEAEQAWRDYWGGGWEIHWLRIGRWSIVLCPAYKAFLAGEDFFETASVEQVSRDSKFWKVSKADRLQQLGRVMAILYTSHVLYDELLASIEAELKELMA